MDVRCSIPIRSRRSRERACVRRSTARPTGSRRPSIRRPDLYYVQTLESCANFVKRPVEWKAGAGYMGGTARRDGGQKILAGHRHSDR